MRPALFISDGAVHEKGGSAFRLRLIFSFGQKTGGVCEKVVYSELAPYGNNYPI